MSGGDTKRAGSVVPPFRPSPEFFADPHPTYRALRDHDPVHASAMGAFVVTRYEDCHAILRDLRCVRDKTLARDRAAVVDEEPDFFGRMRRRWMVYRDPPDHTRLRRLFNVAFTPKVVEGVAGYVETVTRRLLDAMELRSEVDFITELAIPLPLGVIAHILGVPHEDHARFHAWSVDLALGVDIGASPERAQRADVAAQEIHAYLGDLIAARTRHSRDDLVSSLLVAEADGDRLSREEMIANCVLILFAGHETTANFLSNGLLALLDHPDQLARVRDVPGVMKTAMEELLRYEAPVQVAARFAAEEMQLGGRKIPRGAQLILFLGAANRDPRAFHDPDRVDVGRPGPTAMTFGSGIHHCLGAPLARLEGRIAFGQLLTRFPEIALARGFRREYQDTLAFRALRELRVSISAAKEPSS